MGGRNLTEMLQQIDEEIIFNNDDTLNMLDGLLERWDKEWWDNFYVDKERKIPFMTEKPDENLMEFVNKSLVEEGKSLDIGCGNGRNSIYLSRNNFEATAIDISEESIKIAKEYSKKLGGEVNFINDSFFEIEFEDESFDIIHDSGCMHHIKPHRRGEYLSKIQRILNKEGYFTLICFNLDGGANISDYDVYRRESMSGGLAFSKVKLEKILQQYFDVLEIRKMRNIEDNKSFGINICWAVLMKKKNV